MPGKVIPAERLDLIPSDDKSVRKLDNALELTTATARAASGREWSAVHCHAQLVEAEPSHTAGSAAVIRQVCHAFSPSLPHFRYDRTHEVRQVESPPVYQLIAPRALSSTELG